MKKGLVLALVMSLMVTGCGLGSNTVTEDTAGTQGSATAMAANVITDAIEDARADESVEAEVEIEELEIAEVPDEAEAVEDAAEDVTEEAEVIEAVEAAENAEEVTYTYTDVDATMYATTALNVRSGPSTAYGTIGRYTKGDAVTVTGQCNETGWYRVDYNGATGYVSCDYVKDTEPVAQEVTSAATTEAITETTTAAASTTSSVADDLASRAIRGITGFTDSFNDQYIGRVYIPDVGINVGLYASYSQSVGDRSDAACYMWWGSTYLIGDHNTQGFEAINNCVAGQTIMYIDTGSAVYRYICTSVDKNGYNDTSLMTDSNGTEVRYQNSGGITLYTCNHNNSHGSNGITIAYFCPY